MRCDKPWDDEFLQGFKCTFRHNPLLSVTIQPAGLNFNINFVSKKWSRRCSIPVLSEGRNNFVWHKIFSVWTQLNVICNFFSMRQHFLYMAIKEYNSCQTAPHSVCSGPKAETWQMSCEVFRCILCTLPCDQCNTKFASFGKLFYSQL